MFRHILAYLRRLFFGRDDRPGRSRKANQRALPGEKRVKGSSGLRALTPASRQRGNGVSTAFEQLVAHFDKHELHYEQHPELQTLLAVFSCDVGPCRLAARVTPEGDLFQVFGEAPLKVPEGCRPSVAETIARANCGMRVGKFELNLDDGELHFQAYHILQEGNLSEEVIRRLIGTTLAMLDRYVPAVLSVIYGNELPKDAISHVETDLER